MHLCYKSADLDTGAIMPYTSFDCGYYGVTPNEMRYNSTESRARTIQDTFGIKPMEIEEFTKANPNSCSNPTLLDTVIGTAAGAGICLVAKATIAKDRSREGLGLAIITTALGSLVGLAWGQSTALNNKLNAYNRYLDKASAEAREAHDHKMAELISHASEKSAVGSHTDKLDAGRAVRDTAISR